MCLDYNQKGQNIKLCPFKTDRLLHRYRLRKAQPVYNGNYDGPYMVFQCYYFFPLK